MGKNYEINWEKLTQKEAQDIINVLMASFNTVCKVLGSSEWQEVRLIELRRKYDEMLHDNDLVEDKNWEIEKIKDDIENLKDGYKYLESVLKEQVDTQKLEFDIDYLKQSYKFLESKLSDERI